MSDDGIPHISPAFDVGKNSINAMYYKILPIILKKILPSEFFDLYSRNKEATEELRTWLNEMMPVLSHSGYETSPFNWSVYFVCKYRPNAFKFFFEMISRWLIPGKRLSVVLLYGLDFCIPDFGSDVYTLCEVMVQVESQKELEIIKRNYSILEDEIRLGLNSVHHARRIMDVRGLNVDEKTAMIHEHIAYLVKRLPNIFDQDIYTEMQHLLVMCRDDFKLIRESRHMARIICTHYVFRSNLRGDVSKVPDRRHLQVKLIKARLHDMKKPRTVIGVLVGVNFLSHREILEERHIIKAIRNYVPQAEAIENSFFESRRGDDKVGTIYFEIVKKDGSDFTNAEISQLRKDLSGDLKDRIEHLMHPIFMPRNEEEIMKNILTLSNQLKFIRDIPQVMVSFDEQTNLHLLFNVIFVRVLKPEDRSVLQMFNDSGTFMRYVHDRSKVVGYLRKKYPKQASVFRIKLPKERFLRGDHSLDLYRARKEVVTELERVVGEIRDYNGGMISKEHEAFCELTKEMDLDGDYNELLLENYFYSLTPVIVRSVLPQEPLKVLFNMLINALEVGLFKGEKYSISVKSDTEYTYVMMTLDSRSIKDDIAREIQKLSIPLHGLATAFLTVYDIPCLGYIYRSDDISMRKKFVETIREAVSLREKSIVETLQ